MGRLNAISMLKVQLLDESDEIILEIPLSRLFWLDPQVNRLSMFRLESIFLNIEISLTRLRLG